MQTNNSSRPFFGSICFFGIFVTLVLFDQFFKYKIRHGGGFYLCNEGISFGVHLPNIVFWLILGIFFLFFLFLYKKLFFSHTLIVGLALFVGGAISNVIDRLVLGCAVDYISFFNNTFPVFNLADVGISLGGCFLFLTLLLKKPFRGA